MINTPCSAWVALSVPRAIDAVARKICCQHPPPRIPLQAVACGMQVALDTLVEFALSSNTLSPLGFTRVCHDAWYSRAGKEKDSDESPKIPAAAWQAAPGAVCRDWAGWHEAHAEKESVVS